MREVPDCLNRRYQALDDLIRDLSSLSNVGSAEDYLCEPANDAGIKLMCDFWNILKEDPDCNLTKAVRQRMGLSAKSSRKFRPQQVTCYMSCNSNENRKHTCEKTPEPRSPEPRGTCCSSKSVSPKSTNDALPLSKVLCNLKEAVSFDKKCNIRIGELLLAEKQLQDQIQHLEHREKEGIQMLKQADCMWSCMEEAYKTKVAESIERQGVLLQQMKEVETSNTKWRKNKKDLEFQLNNITKCYQEITEKINEKKNDVQCVKMEVATFKKRIESNKKDAAAVKKSFDYKRSTSDAKVASLAAEMTKIKQLIAEETEHKQEKEYEGCKYVKDARDDLQKICKVLLQKKLENEDLKAEKEALLQEIEILKKTCDQCKTKCQNKQQAIIDEIAKIDGEIAGFKVRCIRCHECTDTADVRKFCTDCPRCAEERDCLYEDGHCLLDSAMDCVCMNIKQKFLDNVFDNMYTVLERQAKTCPGKAVADQVLNCLKRSRNGKLNEDTRKILQDFVLTTVKKNLNLTIIGGAVKTRCEMDPETYKQLMLCLSQVKTVKAPKVDKGTAAKKDPCRRWGGASECNCPKGPKSCICTKKAPPPPRDPEPCPPPDKEDASVVVACPHKESTSCGPDCAMHAVPSAVGTEVASWRPAPCDDKHCFSKNMRAAQCVLGPDALTSVSKSRGYVAAAPLIPDILEHEDQIACKCDPAVAKPCVCRKERKSNPRERIIEEVMGRYTDVRPIEKVTNVDEGKSADSNKGRNYHRCACLNFPITKLLRQRTSENKTAPICACTSYYSLPVSHKRYCDRSCQKKQAYLCRRDEKHLKVEVEQCNRNTCALIWEQAREENIIAEKEIVVKKEILQTRDNKVPDSQKKKDIYLQEKTKIKEGFNKKKENKDNKMKKMPSKQTITKRSCFENKNVTFSGTSSEPKVQKNKSFCKDNFKLNEENKTSYSSQITNNLNTQGSQGTMELDENIIKQIEQNMIVNNSISIFLQRTESGHLQVDFSSFNESSSNKQKVLVKRSLSGSLVFEINKSFLSILKPNIIMDEKKLDLDSKSSILVSITPRTQKKKTSDCQNTEKVYAKYTCRLESNTQPGCTRNNDTKETKLTIDRRNSKDTIIKIKNMNGTFIPTKAHLLIAESGNLAFIINDISSFKLLGEIIEKCKEHPILLTESDSGSFVLDCQSEKSNAIIKKTRSGKIMIVKVDPIVKFMETNETLSEKKCNDVFKICVKNSQQKMANPPVVLKSTPSNNYIVVIDKEYETRYKETVKCHLDSNYECPVELVKTSSGNYLVNFEENEENLHVNARLVRSMSGNIKIITTTPDLNRFPMDSNSRPVCPKAMRSSKVLDNLLNTLPVSSKDKLVKEKPRLLETKSSSDGNLYEKVKIRLQNRQNLLSEPSALLKKTSSGQYAVVLNKESKKSFINNLKSYLASNSQGLIPIKRTESGEITIIMNTDNESKGQYGSLKITPSGNIYVLVDEKVIISMAKSLKEDKPISIAESSKAQQEIDSFQNPVNKNITTTCNAFPDNCSCDASKCVCAELLKHGADTSNSNGKGSKCCFLFCKQKDEDLRRNDLKCIFKTCDCGMCPENCASRFDEQKERSPHIVIKSCCCKPDSQKKVKSDSKPMFYNTEEVCPFHKNRYDSVSNELLEISGLCNKNDGKSIKLLYEENDEDICINQPADDEYVPPFRESNLDYLDFLPPQLPHFLRDYRCA